MSAWTFEVVADARGATLHVRHEGEAAARLRVDVDVGAELPRHWYRLGQLVLASPELGLHHRVRTLLLCNDLTGAAEFSAIDTNAQLDREVRRAALTRLFAAALLWLRASGRAPVDERIIVELPGVRDASGRAPFWEALGRHFYDGEPATAAARFGAAWRSHVAALLPRETLLAPFLSEEARRALGAHAPEAAGLAEALCAAGLRDGDFVTLDEGGPVYAARLDLLAAWHGVAPVELRRAADAAVLEEPWLVASAAIVAEGRGVRDGGALHVDARTLDALARSGIEGTSWAARVGPPSG